MPALIANEQQIASFLDRLKVAKTRWAAVPREVRFHEAPPPEERLPADSRAP